MKYAVYLVRKNNELVRMGVYDSHSRAVDMKFEFISQDRENGCYDYNYKIEEFKGE